MVETLDLDDQWSLKEALERRRPSSATWRVCLDAATMYSAALGRQRRAKPRRLSRSARHRPNRIATGQGDKPASIGCGASGD